MSNLPTNRRLRLQAFPKRANGETAQIQSILWESDDPTKIIVNASQYVNSCELTVGPDGEIDDEVDVTVTVDADLGTGVRALEATVTVIIVEAVARAGEALTAQIREGSII